MVFFGEYSITITTGGRIVIPKKIRDLLLGDQFVLTKVDSLCLSAFALPTWESKTAFLKDDSLFGGDNTAQKRKVFSSANYLEIDEQGRVILPKKFLEELKSHQVMIIGVGDHFEIWQKSKWEEFIQNN